MILVTGATGFVGGALVKRLAADRASKGAVAAVRRNADSRSQGGRQVQVGDLLPTTDWGLALQGIHAVVHCAARVHVMQDDATYPLQAYREVNVNGTLNLARQAAQVGVGRFVFVSSIKVNGEASLSGQPFAAQERRAGCHRYCLPLLRSERVGDLL